MTPRMARLLPVGAALVALSACAAPAPSDRPAPSASGAAPRGPAPSASAAASGPPPVERACTRDDECAVALIEPDGPAACCPACATTPGTRAWHAKLQRHCARRAQPPPCGALACPMGPTRAVCRAGRCEATHEAPDGGPARVLPEERCLPAIVCDGWADCAHVRGNEQNGWFVEASPRVPAGELANVESPCTRGTCTAARLHPEGVTCPPHAVPPLIDPPPYACVLRAGRCEKAAR